MYVVSETAQVELESGRVQVSPCPEAQSSLSLCYDQGQGVARDLVQAAKYCRLAAHQGHAGAQGNLGFWYEHGLGGVEKNIEQAVAGGVFRTAFDRRCGEKRSEGRLRVFRRHRASALALVSTRPTLNWRTEFTRPYEQYH